MNTQTTETIKGLREVAEGDIVIGMAYRPCASMTGLVNNPDHPKYSGTFPSSFLQPMRGGKAARKRFGISSVFLNLPVRVLAGDSK